MNNPIKDKRAVLALAMLLAPTPFNFAQSYLLFAALIVLALLHWRPWAVGAAQASSAR